MVLQIWDPMVAHARVESSSRPLADKDIGVSRQQRLAQALVCVIQAFPAIGHGLSGSKTQRSQNTGVLERSFLDRQTCWNKAFGTKRSRW